VGRRRQTADPAWPGPVRRPPWRGGALTIAAAIVLSALPAAPGHALAPSNGAYAGGFLTAAAPLVAMRVASGRVVLEGQAIARCAGRSPVEDYVVLRTLVDPNGSFRGHGVRTYRVSATESRSVSLTASGVLVDPGRAAGSLRLRILVRRRGRPLVRCSSDTQHWEARSASGPASGPPAPLAGVSYYGAIAQRGLLPFPLALHVSQNGARVDAAVYRLYRRCRGVSSRDIANDAPPAAIRPDGSFATVQRYSQRFVDAIESFTFRFAGRFSTMGVGGTLRATSILRGLRTRRVMGRCDSGTVTWTAVP
jgi:hypothetical protein